MLFRQSFRVFVFITALLLASLGVSTPTDAQSIVRWSNQQRIPGYFDSTRPPYLIADQNHTVHAFASQRFGEGSDSQVLITYNRWTAEGGWTTPTDIMMSPLYEARIMGVFLDKTGIIHMLFFGGNDNGANMYYTRVAAVDANKAPAWSIPVPIADSAITPSIAALAGDDKGNLVVVYSGNLGEGNSLYGLYSNDNGTTWTNPSLIWSTYSTQLWPNDLQMTFGPSGQLHAVWNYVDKLGRNVAAYYAEMADVKTMQWSKPVDVDKSVGLGVAALSLIEYHGEVYVFYNNGISKEVAPVLWVRRTSDHGVTWSNPLRPFPSHIGRNGAVSIVVDSEDIMHIFFGQRTPDGSTDIHGMWHSALRNGKWTTLQSVVSGPMVQGNDDSAFDPGDARAVVSQGNLLLVTWATDPGNGSNGVWYSYAQLDTPALAAAPLVVPPALFTPTPVATPIDEQAPTAMPISTREPVTFSNQRPSSSTFTNNAAAPLLAGLIPVLMLLTCIFVVTKVRRAEFH
ncbi:MAG: sialidase family protein [Chloroflexi bacterium]|nr:sialidase family protein [Chloroflexota bacterium]